EVESDIGHEEHAVGASGSGYRQNGNDDRQDSQLHDCLFFQFLTRCSAVRHASACTVSVGLCAPLVPITEPPSTPRFGTSCEKPQRSTTLVSALSPMRVPPYACVARPIAPPSGPRCTAIAPASRYHCSILSCVNAAILRSFSLNSAVMRHTAK